MSNTTKHNTFRIILSLQVFISFYLDSHLCGPVTIIKVDYPNFKKKKKLLLKSIHGFHLLVKSTWFIITFHILWTKLQKQFLLSTSHLYLEIEQCYKAQQFTIILSLHVFIGSHLDPPLTLFYYHHSQLDTSASLWKCCASNSIVIKIWIVKAW